jgi:hypothetical protein
LKISAQRSDFLLKRGTNSLFPDNSCYRFFALGAQRDGEERWAAAKEVVKIGR